MLLWLLLAFLVSIAPAFLIYRALRNQRFLESLKARVAVYTPPPTHSYHNKTVLGAPFLSIVT